MEKEPLIIQPFAVPKPWGGKHLNGWKQSEADKNIGELVLISCIDSFPTYIQGRHGRETFQNYWEQEGHERAIACGAHPENKDFPLLLKVLSTQEPLSLQVHPSTQDLKEHFDMISTGKFESWVILNAEEQAKIFFGLKDEYDKDELTKTHEDPLDLFNCFSAKQGNVFRLEPGLVHGTQGSLLFFEIQQPSDHTFRIHDFGRGRELHLESAQKVIRKKKVQRGDWSEGIKSEYFSLEVCRASQMKDYVVKKPYEVITYFGPPARFSGSFESLEIKWGSTFLFWSGTSLGFEAAPQAFGISRNDFVNGNPLEIGDLASTLPLMNLDEARFFISSA